MKIWGCFALFCTTLSVKLPTVLRPLKRGVINGGFGVSIGGVRIVRVVLGGGFKYFLSSPLLGEMIQFDEHIFQMGGSTTN